MDLYCSFCGEPWDIYHLRHDAISETDIDPAEADAWQGLSSEEHLSARYRERFKAVGWQFGESIMNVIRCPCCLADAKPNPERLATKRALERLFGDDEDGLASTFEDYRL